MTNDNELYHYGVKGMKWGVRRTSTKSPKKLSKGQKVMKKVGVMAVNRAINKILKKRIDDKRVLIAASIGASVATNLLANQAMYKYNDIKDSYS